MNTKMIFLDMDGTLLDDDKNLPKVNREAIDAALEAGHKVLICTGRPLSSAIKLLPVFGLDKPGCYAITFNGGLIYDAGAKKSIYKKTLPLDQVKYPGGYPNSAGFNIMHDACPGHIRTAEAKGILQLCERWRVDAVLNGHSCEFPPSIIPPTLLLYPAYQERGAQIAAEFLRRAYEKKMRPDLPETPVVPRGATFNLKTMIMFASGALPLTLECCVSREYSFDELMEPNYLALEVFLADGLQKPFCNRAEIFKGTV